MRRNIPKFFPGFFFYPIYRYCEKPLAMGRSLDPSWGMICAGFFSPIDRAYLTAPARDESAAHRLARRANALVLLDSGWSYEKVAGALLLDDDTIRRWHGSFIEEVLDGLTRFEASRSACQMNGERQENLNAWAAGALPRSMRQMGVDRAEIQARLRGPLGTDGVIASLGTQISQAESHPA